ncbi:response regulator [Alteromonas sp. C1M14]|uniref:response regulator n=1 Tax=Alteromonas sp. C1M14 TaxID=2841567 RepID=UPI001C07F517|nr:response regulator [Alteromonas sp. C1M14]MBU2978254.1 response regulator [Alteromonas sp. C1M14]
MTAQKILIVEDEQSIAEVLVAYCEQQGYVTVHFSSGQGVVEYIKQHEVDLMVLDLMLPDVGGIEICQRLRLFSNVPIIMLTAKREEGDRLLGLELGADDYICKPFSPKEVVARIKTVLRRTSPTTANTIKYEGFRLSKDNYDAYLHGENIKLTAVEFKIFWLFISHVGRVFSREDIINSVYTCTDNISDRNIDTHIKNIRKKISAIDADVNPIAAVYSVGYKFKSE